MFRGGILTAPGRKSSLRWLPISTIGAGAITSSISSDVSRRRRRLRSAQADLNVIARRLELSYPKTNSQWGATIVPRRDELIANVRQSVLVLLGAVGFVLLIACA